MSLSMEDKPAESSFEEIVGESPALNRLLRLAMKSAGNDAPLLILGEAGSGKELIARAIHRISVRRNESFVKVNCAVATGGRLAAELFGEAEEDLSGPAGRAGGAEGVNLANEVTLFRRDPQPEQPRALEREEFKRLESELFANRKRTERGSGAIGGLERAHDGILFLAEIANLPLDLQARVLRLLQHQEFERPGGTRNIRVNVRLIATTKYDLGERVAEQTFLGDLYDRLNVFCMRVPPLSERREDIPLLANYFMQKFAGRANKQIERIPAEAMNFLVNSDWPGNVRELENLIQQSVSLTEGPELRVPRGGSQAQSERKTG
jgi:formate hydrogenlyase transcriptional activator